MALAPHAIPLPPFGEDLPAYPAALPVANRVPYAYSVDMGVVRSEFAAGNARQRRAYRVMPHALALSFQVRITELNLWQNWVDRFAYSWFLCPVSTMFSSGPPTPGGTIRYEVLRFTSDLQIQSDGWNLFTITVAAEMSADAIAADPGFGSGDWIVAGVPADPALDWIIAGTPSAPSIDTITAGTPALPASLLEV